MDSETEVTILASCFTEDNSMKDYESWQEYVEDAKKEYELDPVGNLQKLVSGILLKLDDEGEFFICDSDARGRMSHWNHVCDCSICHLHKLKVGLTGEL